MNVTSYLALYTTILGWEQYQNLWGIVTGTGLIYLPFLGIVINSTVSTFTSMGAKPASQIALRRMLINILSALLVIAFAATPAVHLDPKVLHFDPPYKQSKTATPGDTGTTYDAAFANIYKVPTGIKIPIFWYFVMAFSNGFTHAANSGLGNSSIDYRALHSQLNLAKIQNPQLKKETTRFYNECYIPAYDTYLGGNLTSAQKIDIAQIIKKYGDDDLSWLGSHVFLNVAGFYNANKAQSPVTGFLFDPERDEEEGQIQDHSKWGCPICRNWWLDSSNGLRTKLIKVLPVSFMQQLKHLGSKSSDLADTSLKTLIMHSFSQSIGDTMRGYASLNNYSNSKDNFLARFVTTPIGIAIHSLKFFPKLHLLINALPLIQASLLFAIYTFLAIAIPFSSYKMSFCVTAAFVIFSLVFCSFIWNVVFWFDHFLIQALYPDLYGVAGMGGILNNNGAGSCPINVLFTNMVIGTLYIVLPLVWMSVMTWAGFKVGGFIGGVVNPMSEPASGAGNEAGKIGESAVRHGAGKIG